MDNQEKFPGAFFTDGTFLTWEELQEEENGDYYDYDANAISDYAIGEKAFCDCDSLKSIDIPNSVEFIGDRAFRGCDSLTSVNLPDNISRIESYAFKDCENLEAVYSTQNLEDLGDSIFVGCTTLDYERDLPTDEELEQMVNEWVDDISIDYDRVEVVGYDFDKDEYLTHYDYENGSSDYCFTTTLATLDYNGKMEACKCEVGNSWVDEQKLQFSEERIADILGIDLEQDIDDIQRY